MHSQLILTADHTDKINGDQVKLIRRKTTIACR